MQALEVNTEIQTIGQISVWNSKKKIQFSKLSKSYQLALLRAQQSSNESQQFGEVAARSASCNSTRSARTSGNRRVFGQEPEFDPRQSRHISIQHAFEPKREQLKHSEFCSQNLSSKPPIWTAQASLALRLRRPTLICSTSNQNQANPIKNDTLNQPKVHNFKQVLFKKILLFTL